MTRVAESARLYFPADARLRVLAIDPRRLDVQVRASGARQGDRGLSKQGNAELRRLLFLCAQASLRAQHDRTFRAQYERERTKGLATTAALCAVARKLAPAI